VAKLFLPSVRCPCCGHANDIDFRFCQRCGYNRKRSRAPPRIPSDVNLVAIDNRLQPLTTYDQTTSYVRQKNSTQPFHICSDQYFSSQYLH
jgi:hypothetical protein